MTTVGINKVVIYGDTIFYGCGALDPAPAFEMLRVMLLCDHSPDVWGRFNPMRDPRPDNEPEIDYDDDW